MVRSRLVLVLLLLGTRADLQDEFYKEAMQSEHLQALSFKDLDDFTGRNRPQPNVMVFLHEGSCHICRDALPKLVAATKDLKRRGVQLAVGHLDCSSSSVSSEAKKRFAIKGFPSLLFWRALSTKEEPSALLGEQLTVDQDESRLRRACRSAAMAESKDAQRVQSLGKTGEVLEVDRTDMTAKLLMPKVGRVWLPLEVLRRVDGSLLPFHRSDAAFHCDASLFGGWRQEAMMSFAERMSRPPVATLETQSKLAALMEEEESPAIIFCGEHLPPAFTEIVATRQDVSLAFHASKTSACPIPADVPQVVVYSPPHQQWPQSVRDGARLGNKKMAAVVASGPLEDATALNDWIHSHRFAGITHLGYNNFFAFVRSQPRVLIVAVDKQDAELNPRVENRLMELTEGEAAKDRKNVRQFMDWNGTSTGYAVGVIDGSLSGLETYGVSRQNLPHMFIMEGADAWVEDADVLRVWELPSNLKRVPGMWRMTRGFMGYVKWFALQLVKSYNFYSDTSYQLAGGPGRLIFQGVFVVWMPGAFLVGMLRLVRLLLKELAATGEEQEKKEQ